MNDAADTRPRRTRVFTTSLILILLVTFAPVLGVLVSAAIASAAGCSVNEAAVTPCIVFGADIGGLLSTLFVGGWYMFFTFPIGVLALSVWTVFLLISIQRRS
jgi:hypothetical protein